MKILTTKNNEKKQIKVYNYIFYLCYFIQIGFSFIRQFRAIKKTETKKNEWKITNHPFVVILIISTHFFLHFFFLSLYIFTLGRRNNNI